jgi:hypothetical protein
MNKTQHIVSKFDLDTRREFLGQIATPLLNLADRIGYQSEPFETLNGLEAGFSPPMLFLITQCERRDAEAAQIRDVVSLMRRAQFLRGGPVTDYEMMWKQYVTRRDEEIRALARERLPWEHFDGNCSSVDLMTPWPDADQLLAEFVFRLLKPYGFREGDLRVGRSTWKCWTKIEGRRVELTFDKGSAQTSYGGGWFVPDFNLAFHIALPFFFSGGSFRASRCHPYRIQLEGFFAAYRHVFPHFWEALSEGLRSANEFLRR